MRLAQLRAAQTTLSTLVDGIPDEREPGSTRALLETLVGRASHDVRRDAHGDHADAAGGGERRDASARAAARVRSRRGRAAARRRSRRSSSVSTRPSAAGIATASTARSCRSARWSTTRTSGCAFWPGGSRRSIDALSGAARDRELRSIWALVVLAALTLAVGIVVSLHVRRLLSPLARVTERARLGRRRRSHARARSRRAMTRSGSWRRRSRRWCRGCRGRRRSRCPTSAWRPSARWRRT